VACELKLILRYSFMSLPLLSFSSSCEMRVACRASLFGLMCLMFLMTFGLFVQEACAQSPLAVDAANASPSGFTSAVNTPTAQVLKEGTMSLSLTNNNPELAQHIKGVGGFGSLNFGVGLLPGLEVFGRLAFEGNLQCNMYAGFLRPGGCQSSMRDLSASAKYQLPLNLPLNTKIALGVTDYGGAATNFRGNYAVATSEQGPFDFSLGYGRKVSDRALLQGGFASTVVRLTDRAQAQIERNGGATRLGASYQFVMGDGADLLLGASRSLGEVGSDARNGKPLNSSQIALTLRLHLDRANQEALKKPSPALARYEAPLSQIQTQSLNQSLTPGSGANALASKTINQLPTLDKPSSQEESAAFENSQALIGAITRAFQADGFTNVKVSVSNLKSSFGQQNAQIYANNALNDKGSTARVFHVSVEPSAYRQSSLFAMGRAIKVWLQALEAMKGQDTKPAGQPKMPSNELVIALTYLGKPILAAKTSEQCAKLFRSGLDICAQDKAIELVRAAELPANFAPVSLGKEEFASPQIELGMALKTAVGTEYGLADYALAAEIGAEFSLANLKPGLGGQILWRAPVSSSGDFKAGGIHDANRFDGARIEQALLTYWMPIKLGDQSLPLLVEGSVQGLMKSLRKVDASLVLSAGSVMHSHTGAQAELYASLDRWRLLSTWGRFTSSEFEKARSPALTALAYSIEPAKWSLELAAGRFLKLDRGWRLGSTHWFGDTSFMAFVRQSGYEGVSMPKRRFAGFEMSFPLGPAKASELAGVSVRARDRWRVGLETKVGESDNYITRGYGLMPSPRHGVPDVTDQDRMGIEALWASRSAMRLALQ
jgi:hypothetical protein